MTPSGYPTTTVTVTVTSAPASVSIAARLEAREGSSTALPSYVASACQNSVRYASACSCAGVTAFPTTTLPLATTTSTVTVAPSQPVCNKFVVQVERGDFDGRYLQVSSENGVTASANTIAEAQVWSLQPDKLVSYVDESDRVWTSRPGSGAGIFMLFSDYIEPYYPGYGEFSDDNHGIFCTPAAAGAGRLSCLGWFGVSYGRLVFSTCPEGSDDLIIADGVVNSGFDSSCKRVFLNAVPVCN